VEDHEEEDFMKSAFTKPKPSEERPGTPSSASMDKNGSAQKDGSQKDKSEASTDASGAGVRLPASLSLSFLAHARVQKHNARLRLAVQFWGRLGGLGLFRKKPTGKEMKLGTTENEFIYNEELGIWHEKGKPPTKDERGPSAPPPIMSMPSGGPGSGSPFPSGGVAPPPSGYPSGPAPLSGTYATSSSSPLWRSDVAPRLT
jgi:hypothetical protein